MKVFGKILKIVAVIILLYVVVIIFFSRGLTIGGPPSTGGLVRAACYHYLAYSKIASTNGEFRFDASTFSEYAKTNYWFAQVGIGYYSTIGLTNESRLNGATRNVELYNSMRAMFNTNQDFWAKTNFVFNSSNREPVIICKQQVNYSFPRFFLGWSWWEHKSVFAVGYSDGTTDVISPEEFQKLNLNGFVPLSSLGIEGFYARFDERSLKP